MNVLPESYNFEKFKCGIVVDSKHNVNYVRRQSVDEAEIVFTIHINNEVLKSWEDLKQKGHSVSFVDLLNYFLAVSHPVLIKTDSERIEGHLRRLASSVKQKFRGKKGRAFLKFSKESKSIAIYRRELRSTAEVEKELCHAKAKQRLVEEENANLQAQRDELHQNLLLAQELEKDGSEKLVKANADIAKIERENVHLWAYFDKISEQRGFVNCGKHISEVKERQQRRKIKELKSYVEKALWFAETFGLHLNSVKFRDEAGMSHTIEYNTDVERKKAYQDLSEDDKDKVQQVLFITDTFCIGEAAYHELTMTDSGQELPRSYLVKQCKTNLNNLCHISKTPGLEEGAQLDFDSELKNIIKKHVSI